MSEFLHRYLVYDTGTLWLANWKKQIQQNFNHVDTIQLNHKLFQLLLNFSLFLELSDFQFGHQLS